MKINLNIDENERQRILEMHNSAKTILFEQGTAFTFSELSQPARKFIREKFGLFPSGTTEEQQIQGLNAAKVKLQSYDMDTLVKEAIAAKVTPENVMALQRDLVTVSGRPELRFISTNNNMSKDFVDGKLGTNTATAWIDYQLYLMSQGKTTTKPTQTAPVQPGSAKPGIQPVYKVGDGD